MNLPPFARVHFGSKTFSSQSGHIIFIETDYEIFFTAPSADSVTGKSMYIVSTS